MAMVMAKAMAMAMTKQQQLNWESMLKKCCLSTYSSSKPLSSTVEQQEPPSPSPSGGGIHRPAYSPPSPPPPPPAPTPPRPTYNRRDNPLLKYEMMGLLRPWCLRLYYVRLGMFGSTGKIQDDDSSVHSDGIPVLRHSDGIQDNDRLTHSDGTPVPRWWEVKFTKPWRLPPSGTSGIPDDNRPDPPPQMSMEGSYSNWEGRLKRKLLGHTFAPHPNYSVQDVVAHRVIGVTKYFKLPDDPNDPYSVAPEQLEYWLDEIQGYYEFMELAHELHSVDRLFPLLHHVLVYPHAASIRAKTAELVTTMVHNNPRSQQLVMELQGLQPLWYNFTSDPDATSRTKALGAISALIRNNKPGITAFRETNGYAALTDALSTETVWFQREALNLIQYLLHENSSDCNTVIELGLPRIMIQLASSDDAEVREAALRGLLGLARNEGGNNGQLVKNDVKLKQVLQELIEGIREEIQLVDSIWKACYNEPSSLKLFEPSLRACGAADQKLPIETLLV